mgnify:CR=1 FL=1
MNQTCLNSTPCPGDLPLANFSSELPDHVDYVTLTGPPPGVLPPDGGNVWKTRYCLGVCRSEISQADADACAVKAALDCLVTIDPNPNGGGPGGGGGWGRPEYPDGSPVAPGSQTPGGGKPIPTFESKAAECDAVCPDGTRNTARVEAGVYTGFTQKVADLRAQQAACSRAYRQKICFGTIEKYVCLTHEYKSILKITGTLVPYSFKITLGELPPGLGIIADTVTSAKISGTAVHAGIYEFEITATDVEGNSAAHAFEIDVLGLANDTDTDFPDASVGEAYSWQFEADGGVEPYTFHLGGGYQDINGIVLDPDGFFHGTPNAPGIKDFTIFVTDSTGRVCSQALQIDIMAELMTEFGCAAEQTSILFGGYVGQIPPLTFSPVDGTVPQGMDLVVIDNHTAALDGVPFPAGTYDFTLRVTDSLKNAVDQPVRFYVLGIINGEDWQVKGGVVGVPYSYKLEALGGEEPDPTYLYQKISGSLPNGLTLHGDGTIDGTPTLEQTTTALIRVYDQTNHFCQQEITFYVYPTPPVDFINMTWNNSFVQATGGCATEDAEAFGGGEFGDVTALSCPPLDDTGPHNGQSTGYIHGSISAMTAPQNTPCRASVSYTAKAITTGTQAVVSWEIRNHNGGIMFSGSATAALNAQITYDFTWGQTMGSLTCFIRADAYTSKLVNPPPGGEGGYGTVAISFAPAGSGF